MRHAHGRLLFVLLVLTAGCTSAGESGTTGADSTQRILDEIDRSSSEFREAYEHYLSLYELETLDGIVREAPPALDEMEQAFVEWAAALQAGEDAGLTMPVPPDLLQRFSTKLEAWIANQHQQTDAFTRCDLTSASADSEVLECIIDNRRLMTDGLELAREVTRLQAEVLGSTTLPANPDKSIGEFLRYFGALQRWRDSTDAYFAGDGIAPVGSDPSIFLRQGRRQVNRISYALRSWWALAEPLAREAGGTLERDVRAYVALSEQWLDVQYEMFDAFSSCRPYFSDQTTTQACLFLHDVGSIGRRHTRLTLALRRDQGVIAELTLRLGI